MCLACCGRPVSLGNASFGGDVSKPALHCSKHHHIFTLLLVHRVLLTATQGSPVQAACTSGQGGICWNEAQWQSIGAAQRAGIQQIVAAIITAHEQRRAVVDRDGRRGPHVKLLCIQRRHIAWRPVVLHLAATLTQVQFILLRLFHFLHPGGALEAWPIRQHMAMFISNHVHLISLYVLMSRS